MSDAGRPRPVLTVLLALLLAGAGAVVGAAFHWFVVDLSDGELLAVARDVQLTGYVDVHGPALDASWAPSFTRGNVHWDVTSDVPVDADTAAADLSAAGWTVTGTTTGNGTATVHAVDGRAAASVHLSPGSDGGTRASIGVSRRSLAPALSACMLVGALVGALSGAWWGWRKRVSVA